MIVDALIVRYTGITHTGNSTNLRKTPFQTIRITQKTEAIGIFYNKNA